MHIQYAPHPPQYSLDLTPDQLARRDRRFSHLPVLWARGILGDVVQDSADLQGAHLVLRQGAGRWVGTPGRLDEHAGQAHTARRPFAGWTERALDYGLALDLAGGPGPAEADGAEGDWIDADWANPDWANPDWANADWAGRVAGWGRGVVYTFARAPRHPQPTVTRRLNLSNFFDRAEFGFLATTDFPGAALIRAHRLAPDGTAVVWRVSRATPGRPSARLPDRRP